jgi:hypothetical protein
MVFALLLQLLMHSAVLLMALGLPTSMAQGAGGEGGGGGGGGSGGGGGGYYGGNYNQNYGNSSGGSSCTGSCGPIIGGAVVGVVLLFVAIRTMNKQQNDEGNGDRVVVPSSNRVVILELAPSPRCEFCFTNNKATIKYKKCIVS